MKSVSFIALAAAMALSVSSPAFAQNAAGTAGGAVDTTTEAGVSAGTGDESVTVDAGVDVDAEVDAEAEAGLDGDTDGDGTMSDDETAAGSDGAANASDSTEDNNGACAGAEYDGSSAISAEDLAVLSAATTARFIMVDDCDAGGSLVSDESADASDLYAAILANAALSSEVSSGSMGEIVGLSIEGDAVTIYVESNDDVSSDANDGTTSSDTDDSDDDAEADAEVDAGATVGQ